MRLSFHRWTMLAIAVGQGLDTGAAGQGPGAATGPARVVEVGAADAAETGKFPRLTNELAQRGSDAVARRDWAGAREIFRELVAAEPGNALALANLGSVEYHLKDYDAAAEHLDAALRARPKLAQTWLTLGMVHYQRDEFFLALSAVSRAVAEKPDDARAHNYLAAVLKALGWTTAAEAELLRALDLDPNYAEAHFNLALIYLERKPPSLEMARRHYLRSLEMGTPKDELVEKQLKDATEEESLAGAVVPARRAETVADDSAKPENVSSGRSRPAEKPKPKKPK